MQHEGYLLLKRFQHVKKANVFLTDMKGGLAWQFRDTGNI